MSNLIHRDVSARGLLKNINAQTLDMLNMSCALFPAVIGVLVMLFNAEKSECFCLSRGWRSHTRQREDLSRLHHTSPPLAPRHFQSSKEALTARILQI